MSQFSKPVRLTSVGVVALPLAVMGFVFGLLTMAVVASDQIEITSPAALLTAGALVYAASLLILSRTKFVRTVNPEAAGETDLLCGLPNRLTLHSDVEALSRQEEEVAIALIDLDGFKQINDHYGHGVGDKLISAFAAIVGEACGDEAKCYRLSGDEFAAIMSGPVAGTILEGICRGLLQQLASPVSAAGYKIHVGASIGLARSTRSMPLSSSELLRRGDMAMYMSKRGGKMRCTWFNQAFDQRREAVREIEDALRDALTNQEFTLAYQPLVDAENGEIVAVESLLRWTREGEPVSPNVFIPIAEESGVINEIGLWVLRQAMCDAMGWGDIMLSVNISAAQLRNPEFPIKLGELIEQTGFPASRLELEITETCLVLDPVVAERSLDVIRGFGVNISLDDFGTGYASIGFLRQFRFEKLKLDRSLVTQAGKDDGSRAMMLSSIAMARALKMRVTAEGVETREQADMVRIAGADQLQGWLYYKALPAKEISQLCGDGEAIVTRDLPSSPVNQKDQAA